MSHQPLSQEDTGQGYRPSKTKSVRNLYNSIRRQYNMNNFFDVAERILTLILPLLAALPGLLALNRQKQLAEAKKTFAEADIDEADAADQIAQTALSMIKHHEEDTQRSRDEADRYKKMVEDYDKVVKELRTEFKGCKDQLTNVSVEMSRILSENASLKAEVKLLRDTVAILTDQLKELGVQPKFGKREDDNKKEEPNA
jgi:hypothetical protein